MHNYKEVYKSICRVCLSHSSYQNMVCLFDHSSADGLSCYGKFIVSFSNIKLDSNHNLPMMMCKNCLLLLKQAITFKYRCENSDLQLKKLMSMSGSGKNYMELICEYTIFKHYFPEECIPGPTRGNHRDNGETKSTFNIKKTDKTDFQKQIKSESKTFNSNDNDDDSTSNYPNCLDGMPNTCETDTETKFQKPQTHSSDSLFEKLEKLIATDFSVDEIVYKRQNRRVKRRRLRKIDFKCTVCNKELASRLIYDRHMQRHNGCRYMCEGCGKTFPTQDELNVHQVSSHGIGSHFKCDHCPFKAARKITLIEHIRLHTGERPYTCEKCGLTFRRKAIYRNHLKYHDEKTVQCPHCPKMFYRNCAMLAHMNNIHERRYVYMCNKCGVTYTKNGTVRRHLTEKHGIPREMQGKIQKVRKSAMESNVK